MKYKQNVSAREIGYALSFKHTAHLMGILRKSIRNDGRSPEEIGEDAGVTGQTVRNIINEAVTRPHSTTIVGVGRAVGLKLTYVEDTKRNR